MPLSSDISLEVLRHLAMQPPAIVRALSLIVDPYEPVEDRSAWLLQKERAINAWIEDGKVSREKSWALAAETPWTAADLRIADALIQELDATVAAFTTDFNESLRTTESRLRVAKGKVDRKALRNLRRDLEEVHRVAAREIEEKVSYAMFLRALRAEFGGETKPGATFDGSDSLQAYLDSLIDG